MRGRDDKQKRKADRAPAQRSGPQPQALAERLLALLAGQKQGQPQNQNQGDQRDR